MTAASYKITVLAGDHVGPEVMQEALKVLKTLQEKTSTKFEISEQLLGGAAIDATGSPFPPATAEAVKTADAILLGAVGGPKWATGKIRPEQGLLDLRKTLDLYANIRPCIFPSDSLLAYSPLKESVVKGTEFIVVRELVGGIYFGERKEDDGDGTASDTLPYSKPEIQRITRLAAHLALQANPPLAIHSIDKANVLATSRLWRKVVTETIEKEYPQLKLDHQLVDSTAMVMVKNPRSLNGIILTENMFGDILSDESSVIPGSLGFLPSASLNGVPDGKTKAVGMYEPIHGSAPDISGKGVVNPVAMILSVAMMLRYSFHLSKEADAIEAAVRKVLDETSKGGFEFRTADVGGKHTTKEIGDKVVEVLEQLL